MKKIVQMAMLVKQLPQNTAVYKEYFPLSPAQILTFIFIKDDPPESDVII